MQVQLIDYPSAQRWTIVKRMTLCTVGKDSEREPTDELKAKLLRARHSPIRYLEYTFYITDVPSWVATHMTRHVHALPFVQSQRTDRTGIDRDKLPQDAPVSMWYVVNAEELMQIANKRLCNKAAPETRRLVKDMCRLVSEATPEIAPFLVPMCEYCGGICHEINGCGKCIPG